MRALRAGYWVIILFTLFAAVLLPAATAQAGTASVRLLAGPLTVSSPTANAVTSVPLDGTVKTASVPLNDLTVTDATGTGAGWHLAIQATPLATTDQCLPAGSLRLTCAGLDSVDTMSPGHLPTDAGACALDTASAVILTDAGPGDAGMGSFSSGSASAITVNVPADTAAGIYSSTVFISLITGP